MRPAADLFLRTSFPVLPQQPPEPPTKRLSINIGDEETKDIPRIEKEKEKKTSKNSVSEKINHFIDIPYPQPWDIYPTPEPSSNSPLKLRV